MKEFKAVLRWCDGHVWFLSSGIHYTQMWVQTATILSKSAMTLEATRRYLKRQIEKGTTAEMSPTSQMKRTFRRTWPSRVFQGSPYENTITPRVPLHLHDNAASGQHSKVCMSSKARDEPWECAHQTEAHEHTYTLLISSISETHARPAGCEGSSWSNVAPFPNLQTVQTFCLWNNKMDNAQSYTQHKGRFSLLWHISSFNLWSRPQPLQTGTDCSLHQAHAAFPRQKVFSFLFCQTPT